MALGSSPDALVIERLTVRPDRIVCDLLVSPSAPTTTSPGLVRRVLADYPTLLDHACVNDEGDTFAAVADHTSLPHLVEHLVIDAQVRQAAQAARAAGARPGRQAAGARPAPSAQAAAVAEPLPSAGSVHGANRAGEAAPPFRAAAKKSTMYVGTTEWVDRFAGHAVVEVSYTDDLTALRSFRDAVCAVNHLVKEGVYDDCSSRL
ncbi:hypothetical protein GMI69_06695 [Eggerthellaceae bacterium zg-887]|uniref:hypothetical protein n=1 Tax=Xiamenia xianingshaonis TaxID=2682776 RepID=UPI00140D0F17|nr:hypothetical protein [Xiamenia xianingshaonis]NHM16346.1 hypothetical protein [Xiamenia xianingshaonis]